MKFDSGKSRRHGISWKTERKKESGIQVIEIWKLFKIYTTNYNES